MKKILSLSVTILFAAGCAASDANEGMDVVANASELRSTLCRAADGPPVSCAGFSIAGEVLALKGQLTPGRHDFERVASNVPFEMLKQYIEKRFADDPDALNGFEFDQTTTTFYFEESRAGLFSSADRAVTAAVGTLEDWFDHDFEGSQKILSESKRHLENLKSLGAVFGSDGSDQHGCAAGNNKLVVLDKARKTADGIDLNPCEE